MRFGVSNHGVENFSFVNPTEAVEARLRERRADLYGPAWLAFYNVADRGTRSPPAIRPGPWMVDDTIGSTWGYTAGMKIASAATIIGKLVDTVSKGGFYLLNIAPRADGTIPGDQQQVLLTIGAWLQRYGDAI